MVWFLSHVSWCYFVIVGVFVTVDVTVGVRTVLRSTVIANVPLGVVIVL